MPGAPERGPGHRRNTTVGVKACRSEVRANPLSAEERAELRALKPKRREDCVNGLRPCPFVSCRHHLFLDVNTSGSIVFNAQGGSEACPTEMQETCALDVAERGGVTLEVVGAFLNVTRERVRQIEGKALKRLKTGVRGAAMESVKIGD